MKNIKTQLAAIVIAVIPTCAVYAATIEEAAKAIPVEFHVKGATIVEVIEAMKTAAKTKGSDMTIAYAPSSPDQSQSTRVTLDLKKTNLWEVAKDVAGLTNATVKVGDSGIIIDGSQLSK
jgi:hypothetical protein